MERRLDIVPVGEWGIFPEGKPLMIAGPCSAESEVQVMETARRIKSLGINVFRAGIWKPRTHPNTFEGVGTVGLKWMQRVKNELGMKICTEVASEKHIFDCLKFGVDMIWIGARTTANPFLVQEIADALKDTDIPVLVKNPVNPDIDLWIGALERLNQAGLLDSYSPQNASAINLKMRARDFSWFGINAWGGSICINTELLKKYKLPIPKTWDDLLDPIYKGRIVMPNPVASSTGFMFLMGWLQAKGEKVGWRYIEKLHENILFYTASGARPAAMAAQGEIPIALTSEAFVRPFMRFSIPVITVEPQEGIAWDAEGCALPKGSPHPILAKRFLDFCASKPVADIAASFSGISSIDRYSTETGKKLVARFLTLDFRQAAIEKKTITDQWQSIASR